MSLGVHELVMLCAIKLYGGESIASVKKGTLHRTNDANTLSRSVANGNTIDKSHRWRPVLDTDEVDVWIEGAIGRFKDSFDSNYDYAHNCNDDGDGNMNGCNGS